MPSLTGIVLRSIAEKRVAYGDKPAKNLKSYFRAEILREKEQEAGLRMIELLLVHRFFVSPSGKNGSE